MRSRHNGGTDAGGQVKREDQPGESGSPAECSVQCKAQRILNLPSLGSAVRNELTKIDPSMNRPRLWVRTEGGRGAKQSISANPVPEDLAIARLR